MTEIVNENNESGSEVAIPQLQIKGLDKQNWLNIFNAINTLREEEITLDIRSDKITSRFMDASHVALIDLEIPNTAFEKFDIVTTNVVKIGLLTDGILKIVKTMHKEDKLRLTLLDNNTLSIKLTESDQSFNIRLIESEASVTPLPKLNFNAKYVIDKKVLEQSLKSLAVIGDYVQFEGNNNSLTLSTRGDSGESNKVLSQADNTLYDISVNDDSKATYSLEYLIEFLRAVKTDRITLEFSTKIPLMITIPAVEDKGKLGYGKYRQEYNHTYGSIKFYLAPRIEG